MLGFPKLQGAMILETAEHCLAFSESFCHICFACTSEQVTRSFLCHICFACTCEQVTWSSYNFWFTSEICHSSIHGVPPELKKSNLHDCKRISKTLLYGSRELLNIGTEIMILLEGSKMPNLQIQSYTISFKVWASGCVHQKFKLTWRVKTTE